MFAFNPVGSPLFNSTDIPDYYEHMLQKYKAAMAQEGQREKAYVSWVLGCVGVAEQAVADFAIQARHIAICLNQGAVGESIEPRDLLVPTHHAYHQAEQLIQVMRTWRKQASERIYSGQSTVTARWQEVRRRTMELQTVHNETVKELLRDMRKIEDRLTDPRRHAYGVGAAGEFVGVLGDANEEVVKAIGNTKKLLTVVKGIIKLIRG